VPKPLVVLAGLLGAVGASRVVVGRVRTPATSCAGGACPRRPSGREELGASAGVRRQIRCAGFTRGTARNVTIIARKTSH